MWCRWCIKPDKELTRRRGRALRSTALRATVRGALIALMILAR